MLQRLAAWCYRRRRRVLVAVDRRPGRRQRHRSNVGASFSQGFSLSDTESQRAAQLLEARFPARAGDEGQIVFAHDGRRAGRRRAGPHGEALRRGRQGSGVTGVVSPYSTVARSQVARDGDIAYATVQFDKHTSKSPTPAIEHHPLPEGRRRGGHGLQVELGGRMFQETRRHRPGRGSSASSPPS